MDPMLLGETLAVGSTSTTYVGKWMPSGGSQGIAAIEVFHCSAASIFTVKVQTKSSDEDDPLPTAADIGNEPIGAVPPNDPKVYRFEIEPAKDLVRYVVAAVGPSANFLHFQLVDPTWAPN